MASPDKTASRIAIEIASKTEFYRSKFFTNITFYEIRAYTPQAKPAAPFTALNAPLQLPTPLPKRSLRASFRWTLHYTCWARPSYARQPALRTAMQYLPYPLQKSHLDLIATCHLPFLILGTKQGTRSAISHELSPERRIQKRVVERTVRFTLSSTRGASPPRKNHALGSIKFTGVNFFHAAPPSLSAVTFGVTHLQGQSPKNKFWLPITRSSLCMNSVPMSKFLAYYKQAQMSTKD